MKNDEEYSYFETALFGILVLIILPIVSVATVLALPFFFFGKIGIVLFDIKHQKGRQK